jgi:CHAD domain-containing protein
LHKLRIRVKKLRYAAEFLAALSPDPATESYLSALRGVQDEVGSFNDATRNMA